MIDEPRTPSSRRPRRATSSGNWVFVAIVVGVVAYSAVKPWLFDPQQPAQETSKTSSPQTNDGSAIEGRKPDLPIVTPGKNSRETSAPVVIPSQVETPLVRPQNRSQETLRETRPGVLESKAGLIYRQGGAQGHWLDHVMEHATDDLSKPTHGVFLGSREEILALIDEAWETAQKRGPPDVKIEREGERTVYTVNLKRKIGSLGGQSGKRKNHPALKSLRLVLEERDVITAFPVAP